VILATGFPANCGSPTATFSRQHAKRSRGNAGFSVVADRIDRVVSPQAASQVTVQDCVLSRMVSAGSVTDYSMRFVPSTFNASCEFASSSDAAVAAVSLTDLGAIASYQSSGSVIVQVRSTEGESQLIPLTMSSNPAATVETFVSWASGSLGKHIYDGMYSRLSGKSPPPLITAQVLGFLGRPTSAQWRWGSPINMWSVAPMSASTAGGVINSGNNNPAGPWVRDPSFFLADVDFTCVSVWNQGTNGIVRGTLVTPEHFISCAHGWQPKVGDTLYFAERTAATGQSEIVHTRTVTHAQRLPQTQAGYSPDITVGRLSSPLPATITPARVMPKTASDKIKGHMTLYRRFGGDANMLPIVCFNQDFQALLHGAWTFGAQNTLDLPSQYRDFTNYVRFLDSGNPAFCIVNNTAVLISTHTASTQGAYVSLPSTYDGIEAMMASQGGATTTLTPIDLSGFSSY
jgi:hypothetical protein